MQGVQNQTTYHLKMVHEQPLNFAAGESLEIGPKPLFIYSSFEQQPRGSLISRPAGVFKEAPINQQKCVASMIGGESPLMASEPPVFQWSALLARADEEPETDGEEINEQLSPLRQSGD